MSVVSISGLPTLGIEIFYAVISSAVILFLGYLWEKSEASVVFILKNSLISKTSNKLVLWVKHHFEKKLSKMENDEFVDFLTKNPSLIEPRFQIVEYDSYQVTNGLTVEPALYGEDDNGRDTLVFIQKEFDSRARKAWLQMIGRHANPEYRVIIAAISFPEGIEEIQEMGIEHIRPQDDLLRLSVAFLTEFYEDRL